MASLAVEHMIGNCFLLGSQQALSLLWFLWPNSQDLRDIQVKTHRELPLSALCDHQHSRKRYSCSFDSDISLSLWKESLRFSFKPSATRNKLKSSWRTEIPKQMTTKLKWTICSKAFWSSFNNSQRPWPIATLDSLASTSDPPWTLAWSTKRSKSTWALCSMLSTTLSSSKCSLERAAFLLK